MYMGETFEFKCIMDLLIVCFDEKNRKFYDFQLNSKGYDSYAGNLYGVEFSKKIIERDTRTPVLANLGYHVSVSGKFAGRIIKIVGIGEVRKEDVVTAGNEEEIGWFFPKETVLPDVISIDKRTLEVIGFQFDTGKWLYIFPDREGSFRIELDMETPPNELILRWDFEAMEKQLQILQVFE